jgi:type IV pilus assembly protein PilP
MSPVNLRLKQNAAYKMLFRISAICLVSLGLVACNGDEGDDLDNFIKNSAKDMRPQIKPLPEVKPYLALQYNADGKLSDPFRARKASNKNSNLQPNLNRPKEPMEAYPLESVKYVGLLSKAKLTYALLLTPDNGVQQVKVGNYVGQNFGMVTNITDSEVVLKEIVQDELSGDWIERVSSLALQE